MKRVQGILQGKFKNKYSFAFKKSICNTGTTKRGRESKPDEQPDKIYGLMREINYAAWGFCEVWQGGAEKRDSRGEGLHNLSEYPCPVLRSAQGNGDQHL